MKLLIEKHFQFKMTLPLFPCYTHWLPQKNKREKDKYNNAQQYQPNSNYYTQTTGSAVFDSAQHP